MSWITCHPSASMETMKLVQKVSDATGNVFLLLLLMETSTTVSVYALQIIVTTALRSANAGTAYASEKAPASSVANTSNETTFLICAPSSISITPVSSRHLPELASSVLGDFPEPAIRFPPIGLQGFPHNSLAVDR